VLRELIQAVRALTGRFVRRQLHSREHQLRTAHDGRAYCGSARREGAGGDILLGLAAPRVDRAAQEVGLRRLVPDELGGGGAWPSRMERMP
jgi:hypothetical protein